VRIRAALGGIFASAAVLGIGWQFGSAAATTFAAHAAGSATTTAPSATTAPAAAPSAAASAAPAPAPSASAGAAQTTTGRSGTFVGDVASTPFGDMQVEIIVSSGKITDVKALKLTDQGGRSVQISNYAAPILRTEALKAQSAKIDSVSGATYTSDGYATSLQSAIDKAGL